MSLPMPSTIETTGEMAWWRSLEAHQRAAIITGTLLIAVSLIPLLTLLGRYGDKVTDYRIIGAWVRPMITGASVAAILVTAAFWLKKRR
jgi:hypothetical protein